MNEEQEQNNGTAPAEPAPTAAPADNAPPTLDSDSDEERRHFTISQSLFEELLSCGYSENAIKKSIVAGCIDASTCTQWIKMHEGHPELDTPLEEGVEVVVKAKRVLTEEEKEEQKKELQARIKRKKEEEKLEAVRKERERVEMGRKALEAKEHVDAIRRQMELEEVKREKAADAAARRRVKIQIMTDRYMRQGKSAEEAQRQAEEEFEAEAEKARAAAAARVEQRQKQLGADVANSSTPSGGGAGGAWDLGAIVDTAEDKVQIVFAEPMEHAAAYSIERLTGELQALGAQSPTVTTLRTVLSNILASPLDVKKRTLRTNTKAFTNNIATSTPALRLLRWCYFDLVNDPEDKQVAQCNTVIVWRIDRALQCVM